MFEFSESTVQYKCFTMMGQPLLYPKSSQTEIMWLTVSRKLVQMMEQN